MTDGSKQAENIWMTRNFHPFLSNVIFKVIILSVNSHRSKILGGGKVNQLGYVAPHLYMDEFQEIGFCIPAGSICILWNISVYSC